MFQTTAVCLTLESSCQRRLYTVPA